MDQPSYNKFISTQPKLYRFALSLTKNVDDAEDIYQETLMKLWQLKEKWEELDNFEAYAMRMVRNAFFNYSRKNSRQVHIAIDAIIEHQAINETDANIVLADLRMQFNDLISKLPEIQRNILYLREIEELEYKEIGEVLNITEAKVRVYLFRGRQYLKNKTHGKR